MGKYSHQVHHPHTRRVVGADAWDAAPDRTRRSFYITEGPLLAILEDVSAPVYRHRDVSEPVSSNLFLRVRVLESSNFVVFFCTRAR
jgi:hypothetical protein